MTRFKYWLISGLMVIGLIGFGIILGLGLRRIPDVGQPRSDREVWIYQNHPITQSVTPENNGFNVITIYMKNVALRNQKPLEFSLKNGSQVLRTIHLTGYNIGDGDSVRFQFEPLNDSAKKTYQITLSSPASVISDAIGVGFSGKSISYQTYYFPLGRGQVIKQAVIDFLTSFFRPLFLLISIFAATVVIGFSYRLFRHV